MTVAIAETTTILDFDFKIVNLDLTGDENGCPAESAAAALNSLEAQGYKFRSMTTQNAMNQGTGFTLGTFVLVPNHRPLNGSLILRNFVIQEKGDVAAMRQALAELKQQGYRILSQHENTIWRGKHSKITNKQIILRG